MPYFNYDLHAIPAGAASYWQRRAFVNAWWAIARDDERWTPPPYARLRRALNPRHNGHLARLDAALLTLEALHYTGLQRARTDQQEIPLTSVLSRPLAAAVVAADPRRRDATAQVAFLHAASEPEALDRLYDYLAETWGEADYHRAIGPVGLSPHLGSGLLVDAWDAPPPQHTPTNPPYLPELVERRARAVQTGRLYHVAVAEAGAGGTSEVRPFAVERLAGDLLPLLAAATENAAGFPSPDAAEAAFLLGEVGSAAAGGLVERDGAPVGFVLLAPDAAARLRATRGGRPLWGRAALALAGRRPTTAGRLLWGGVLPAWRGQGVGRALWAWARAAAAARGWATLTAGPVWLPRAGQPAAAAFLLARGAVARQTYRLYEWTF